jgi:Leucine-rich repeat (LRR) protein
LEDNKLIEIEDNQFDQLSSLWLLHLWGNKLSRLSNNSFAGLVELRHLDLSHNRLPTLSPAVLAPLQQLEHLDLSENRFKTLSSDLLLRNRKLQLFKLERNAMQTVAEPDAEWLQSLELPQGLLSDLSRLTWVSMADSAVAELPRFLLRGSPSLLHLDLRGNQLTTIPR